MTEKKEKEVGSTSLVCEVFLPKTPGHRARTNGGNGRRPGMGSLHQSSGKQGFCNKNKGAFKVLVFAWMISKECPVAGPAGQTSQAEDPSSGAGKKT